MADFEDQKQQQQGPAEAIGAGVEQALLSRVGGAPIAKETLDSVFRGIAEEKNQTILSEVASARETETPKATSTTTGQVTDNRHSISENAAAARDEIRSQLSATASPEETRLSKVAEELAAHSSVASGEVEIETEIETEVEPVKTESPEEDLELAEELEQEIPLAEREAIELAERIGTENAEPESTLEQNLTAREALGVDQPDQTTLEGAILTAELEAELEQERAPIDRSLGQHVSATDELSILARTELPLDQEDGIEENTSIGNDLSAEQKAAGLYAAIRAAEALARDNEEQVSFDFDRIGDPKVVGALAQGRESFSPEAQAGINENLESHQQRVNEIAHTLTVDLDAAERLAHIKAEMERKIA